MVWTKTKINEREGERNRKDWQWGVVHRKPIPRAVYESHQKTVSNEGPQGVAAEEREERTSEDCDRGD